MSRISSTRSMQFRHSLPSSSISWRRGISCFPPYVIVSYILRALMLSLQLELCKVPTSNRAILDWVESVIKLCKPDTVRWCDGSEEEYHELCQLLCEKQTFVKLNEKLRPNSYLARSTEDDVARVEDRTFICSSKKEGTDSKPRPLAFGLPIFIIFTQMPDPPITGWRLTR